MIRLFVALDLADDIKKELENFARSLNIEQARIIQAHNLHITVKFLGYVEDDMLSSIDNIIDEVSKKIEVFNIILDKLGAFPSRKRGRILWVGTSNSMEAKELSEHLDSILKELGFKVEKRPFKIHLTLARLKKPIDLSKYTEQKLEPIKQNIDHITLYESKLSPKGAQYKALKKYYLKYA